MVLGGYFDESLRPVNDEPFAVGGYLFKPAAYKKFCKQWSKTVLKHGPRRFAAFHMTDLCAGKQEYDGLTISERVEILDKAVDAVAKYSYGGLAVYFEQAEFARLAPQGWPEEKGSIYSAACQMTLHATGFWLNQWKCPMRVLYTFESGHKFQHEADVFLRAIGQVDEAATRFHYRNHVFEDKAKECGLQAGDLAAWFVTKAGHGEAGKGFLPFWPSLKRLADANRDRFKVHPMTGDTLRRFFEEQAKTPLIAEVNLGPRKRAFR